MNSAFYRNYKPYANSRDSSSSRQSRYASTSASSPTNGSNFKSSSGDSFIYNESKNKHHWAKLQSKIKQRLMAEKNISYIEDEEEMARRSIPPPPAAFLAPPAFLETPQDKKDRQR